MKLPSDFAPRRRKLPQASSPSAPAVAIQHYWAWFALPCVVDIIGVSIVASLANSPRFGSTSSIGVRVALLAFFAVWGGICDVFGFRNRELRFIYLFVALSDALAFVIVILVSGGHSYALKDALAFGFVHTPCLLILNSVVTAGTIGQRTARFLREQQRELDEMEGESGTFDGD